MRFYCLLNSESNFIHYVHFIHFIHSPLRYISRRLNLRIKKKRIEIAHDFRSREQRTKKRRKKRKKSPTITIFCICLYNTTIQQYNCVPTLVHIKRLSRLYFWSFSVFSLSGFGVIILVFILWFLNEANAIWLTPKKS